MLPRIAIPAVAVLLACLAAAAAAPPAAAAPAGDARAIRAGLASAVKAGRLSPDEASAHRATLARTMRTLRHLPGSRRTTLARALGLVRRQSGAYNRPRATALFGMLAVNTRYLAARGLPPDGTDVVGPGGVVYRAGWGYGLQFHPLANVIALNQHLIAERRRKALALARALEARLVPRKRGAVLEYYFPFGGGAPPWSSGMAQAVGAQAFARTARRLGVPRYFAPAARSYKAISGALVMKTASGPWIRLYSFSSMLVLNAQLQAALSLANYGTVANVPEAMGLGDRLEDSARAALGRFDTGFWTNYRPGSEAPLKYHLYHVDLARRLAKETRIDFWRNAHGRFDRYSREAPVFRAGRRGPVLYPWPADGFRDQTRVRFWVSKISTVTVRLGGRTYRLGRRPGGWHAFVWRPGRIREGTYRPRVTAVDLAGNRGAARVQRITVAVDRTPPAMAARVRGARLSWTGKDPATPWLRLRVRLVRGGTVRVLDLGRRPLAGSVRLRLPRGAWDATLVAADSSGNRARVALGRVPTGR